ncbi:hypothetical protein [Nocardioides lijunqiniae]|uniref:hypothetical protein n=1 Tax=Nocardioides lijunqiniae TaxID=2760832 RepID=UPI0018785D18|nr:hypothetical protein [Nocardioides lijunqiniae]
MRTLGPVTALALVLVLVSGCSDDDPSGEPGGSESPTASASSPEATEGSPSASEDPSPEPAEGEEVRVERLAIRAPEGWTVTKEGDPYSAQIGKDINAIYIQELPDFGGGKLSLQEVAQTRLRNGPYLREPKIMEPVTVAGQEWYHIAGRATETTYAEDFGTVADGLALLVAMSFDRKLPEAERQEIVDTVLASVTFE